MSQVYNMNSLTQQDRANNPKAAAITAIVHGVILFIFFVIPMAATLKNDPIVNEEGIEVNLGNSDIGFGDVQPLAPGDPAPVQEEQASPAPQQIELPNDDVEKETSDRDDVDAPVVNKPEKKTTPSKIVTNTPPVAKTKPATQPVVNPTPAPPKPKATMSAPGGTGPGGNNSDTYNNSKNQGIAGGKGDQGKPNGNPNSDNYNGNGGTGSGTKSGPRITRGDRKIVKYYSFTADLERATIFALVKVSPDGRGTFAGFGPGSTTQGSAYRNKIVEALRNIEFDKSDHESTVTVEFKFTVN
jgi:hypothetical protein